MRGVKGGGGRDERSEGRGRRIHNCPLDTFYKITISGISIQQTEILHYLEK